MVYNSEKLAKIKNKANQCHLLSELQRIDREKKNEIRMLNTEMTRFQYKCSRLNLRSSRSMPVGKVSEEMIRGKPSIQFRNRTGNKISNPELQIKKSMDFESIHDLVFTEDAVDVEKILCLHLLSAHRAETLTPANKTWKYLCKDHSPAEKLIERSKRGFINHEKISLMLPLYTIELVESGAMGEQAVPVIIKDGRLAARILLNQQLRLLINTVVGALEVSNPLKLQNLLRIGKDPSLLKILLTKSKVLKFMEGLQNHPIITHCDSFILTPPFVIKSTDLAVKSKTGKIESLIKSIRESVLQIPQRVSLSESEEKEMDLSSQQKAANNPEHRLNVRTYIKPNSVTRNSSFDYNKVGDKNDKLVKIIHKLGTEGERKPAPRIRKNFVLKNIQEAANTRKIEYDTDDQLPEITSLGSLRRQSVSSNFRKNWENRSKNQVLNYNVSTQRIEEEHEEEMESATVEKIVTKRISVNTKTAANSPEKTNSEDSDKHKQYIKLTTCPACMERWKTPLPSPKTPRIKRPSVSSNEDEKNLLKTNSINRINALIERELYKLDSYDRRYSSDSQPSRRSIMSRQETSSDSTEYIKMTPLELARIQQEIKEKETQKKLEKFLKESVDLSQKLL